MLGGGEAAVAQAGAGEPGRSRPVFAFRKGRGALGQALVLAVLPAGYWIHVAATGSTRAPGPGSPVEMSTRVEPDVASQ